MANLIFSGLLGLLAEPRDDILLILLPFGMGIASIVILGALIYALSKLKR